MSAKGAVAHDQKPLKSAFKPGKEADEKPNSVTDKPEDYQRKLYKAFLATTDIFTINTLPRNVVRELIAVATREIKARGKLCTV